MYDNRRIERTLADGSLLTSLEGATMSLTRNGHGTNGSTPTTNGRAHPPATVLMVDDDPGVLGAMSEMLELEGYTTHELYKGREFPPRAA